MTRPVTPFATVAVVIATVLFAPLAAAGESPRPVVVELFTSQGCNSCPPADEVLGELAERDDVLPLSFHVTYWDRLGWPDTFGLDASTERQRDYARSLGLQGIYTPQMVIDGRVDVVGSRRSRVLQAIDLLHSNGTPGPMLEVEGDRIVLAAWQAGQGEAAIIWLIGFDHAHDVDIARGENRGRRLRYHNVVREIAQLGDWHGEARTLTLPLRRLAGRDEGVILVQREHDGAILAAARLPLQSG